MSTLVAPSLLASDFSQLGNEANRALNAGADWIHLDIMDGHFVDNISIGPAVCASIRNAVGSAPFLDAHLMIERPDHYFDRFVKAGVNLISVHVELADRIDLMGTLAQIRQAGLKNGIVINPSTPFENLLPYLGHIDLLLVMSVVPGFGGQAFMPQVLDKVRRAVEWRTTNKAEFLIEIDGGIDQTTAPQAIEAGVDVLVAGSSIFNAPDIAEAINTLKSEPARPN